MRKKSFAFRMTIGCLFLLGCWSLMVSAAATGAGDREILYPKMTNVKPKIDGELDEEIWKTKPLERDFGSYSPHVGETLPYKTLIWMSYDKENLYFAFLCLDPEPGKIRTAYRKRDSIFDDDWVGISLDSLGTKQTAWALMVNPNGVQGDILDSAVSGSHDSPDLVWESAGKVTDKGYQVEIGIPLRSIGFKGGEEVKMGVLFWRYVVRLGIRACWPKYLPGNKVFGTHTSIIYKDIKKPLTLNLLPNIVYGSNKQRESRDQWGDTDVFKGVGLDIEHALTSSIKGGVTINPDYSQVESDTFQVEVNQRYPLFYAEKRPFFMDMHDIFDFYTIRFGAGSWLRTYLPNAVHTRRIVDPLWGAKLNGNFGKFAFGILSAGDEQPGQTWESGVNPNEGKKAFWGIARAKYSLGKDSYIGALYSGREFAGDYNRVFGVDGLYRFLTYHRINASFLRSTAPEINPGDGNNNNFNLSYDFQNTATQVQAAFQHIGSDFRMDSSFVTRRGLNDAQIFVAHNILPKFKKFNFLKVVRPGIQYQHLHDLSTGMDDSTLRLFLITFFAKTASAWVNYYDKKESWQGETFDMTQVNAGIMGTVTKWLLFQLDFMWGDKIYYGGDPAFKGKWFDVWALLDMQPSTKLNLRFVYQHSNLSKDGQKIYNVNILSSSNTYQFNKRLFFRAIIQYNDYQKRLITDLLASYTLNPGTVLHIGYGGLYEGREWMDNKWAYGQQYNLLHVKRSFFAKVSYLWRL
ncbi:MAG: hypothetical protein GY950_30930 [bacterium]|nr:hypothetical protein [bacterium]